MYFTTLFSRIIAVLLMLHSGVSLATDVLREQALTNEYGQRSSADEAPHLEAGGRRFFALFRDALKSDAHGGIVLLNDFDRPLDSTALMQALRKTLPERGWATLAIQTPLREAGAAPHEYLPLLPETVERIQAAVGFLQERKIENIALLGFRHGGMGIVRYLANQPANPVRAAVLLNLPGGDTMPDTPWLEDLGKVKLPLLDLWVGPDADSDAEPAWQRRQLTKNNAGYRLSVIGDARSTAEDVTGLVVNRIHGWLLHLGKPSVNPSSPMEEAPGRP